MTITSDIMAAYGASALGFLFVELIKVGGRRPKTKFQIGYYLEQNWENLAANACASVLLLLGLNEIGRLEVKYLGENYMVLTAGLIGAGGSWLLRTLIDKAKSRFPDVPPPPTPPEDDVRQ